MTIEPDQRDDTLIPLALACVKGVGPVTIRRLMTSHSSIHGAFCEAAPEPSTREQALGVARRVRARCAERGIELLAPGDGRYPSTLLDLEDPPAVLYALGKLQLVDLPAVALVGARRATPYGLHVAREFALQLAATGVSVVSGLAMGIDAAAHEAALDVRGATIAVQGTGVDVPYPRSNLALHARIARDGLVLSELPPGRAAHPGAFPRRNRLIAALADVVVVVEAGSKSGALITAQLGGALGRMVAAVPGPIDRESSVGANHLLRDGAHVVASTDDVLALLALTPRGRSTTRDSAFRAPTDASHADASRADASRADASRADASRADGSRADASRADASRADGSRADASRVDGSRVDGSRPAAAMSSPLPFADDAAESRVLRVLSFGPQGPDELVRACGVSPREVGIAIANLVVLSAVEIDASGFVRRRGAAALVRAT